MANWSDQFISITESCENEQFSFISSEFDNSRVDGLQDTSGKNCENTNFKNHFTDLSINSINENKCNISTNNSNNINKFNLINDTNSNNSNESFHSNHNVNDSHLSVDRFINDSSVNGNTGSPDVSFAAASVLKNIRKKYLTPEICTYLNRNVRMVEKKNTNRRFEFKCHMHIPEISEILKENNTNIPTKKLLKDFIRIGYLTKNNACDINFKHTRINKESFVAYGYCTDLECNLYTFSGDMNGKIRVYKSQKEIVHTINNKGKFQCRGAQRYLEKSELLNESALTYQKKKINKQSDELRLVDRSQMIRSLSNIRNIKAESAAEHDRDPDPFVDTYLMFKTDYNHYIQHLSTKLEVFLWSKKTNKCFKTS